MNFISLQATGLDFYNAGAGAGLLGFFFGSMAVMFIVSLGVYIYTSLALMKVAQRLKTEPVWLAWVPIGNLYLLSKMAKMHWWPILLLLVSWIPFVGIIVAVFVFIWTWRILEARKRPGWWVLLTLVPIAGGIWYLVMWGILAWSKK